MPETTLPPDVERIFAAKKEWHKNQSRKPLKEKVADLLAMQRNYYPILKKRGKLKVWEQPWNIQP